MPQEAEHQVTSSARQKPTHVPAAAPARPGDQWGTSVLPAAAQQQANHHSAPVISRDQKDAAVLDAVLQEAAHHATSARQQAAREPSSSTRPAQVYPLIPPPSSAPSAPAGGRHHHHPRWAEEAAALEILKTLNVNARIQCDGLDIPNTWHVKRRRNRETESYFVICTIEANLENKDDFIVCKPLHAAVAGNQFLFDIIHTFSRPWTCHTHGQSQKIGPFVPKRLVKDCPMKARDLVEALRAYYLREVGGLRMSHLPWLEVQESSGQERILAAERWKSYCKVHEREFQQYRGSSNAGLLGLDEAFWR